MDIKIRQSHLGLVSLKKSVSTYSRSRIEFLLVEFLGLVPKTWSRPTLVGRGGVLVGVVIIIYNANLSSNLT